MLNFLSPKDNTPPNSPEDVVIGNGNGNGDGFITPDEIANGKVDVVVVLPETGVSVGDKVIVNGEEHIITAGDLTAGQITVPVTVPPEGQPLEVEVSIKDPAGNTSSPVTETATVDTTAPTAPKDIVIGDGDGFITPDEITNGKVDVVVILPETGVSVGDKVIVNGEEHTITAGDLTTGQITVPVTVPPEGQALEVEVSIKDPAGNTSSPVRALLHKDLKCKAPLIEPNLRRNLGKWST